MSGPPYPAPSTNNAIGSGFVIGVSPIGTISTWNIWLTILSQYSNSPAITGILTAFNAAVDQVENFDNFFDLIWNLLTAQGYGLDVWGRILGVPRTLAISGGGGGGSFGFNEPGNDWVGFNQAPFASGVSPTTNVTLTDTQYLPVLLAKAASNISDGSIESMNSILLGLFSPRGTPYVQDNQNMSLTLVFPFSLTTLDTGILNLPGILPYPCGVIVNTSSP